MREEVSNGAVDFCWSPSSTHIALIAGWPDTTITTCDVQKLYVKTLRQHVFRAVSLAWSPDGSRISACSEGQISIWNAERGSLVKTLASGGRACTQLAWSEDGRSLGVCCQAVNFGTGSPSRDELKIWDTVQYRTLNVVAVPEGAAAGWSHDLKRAAWSGGSRREIVLYDFERRARVAALKTTFSPSILSWSPDSQLLAASHPTTYTLPLWITVDGASCGAIANGRMGCWLGDSNNLAVIGRDGTVQIWTGE
jgi:WD40 repeat protein